MTRTLQVCAVATLLLAIPAAQAQVRRDWADPAWAYRKVLEVPAEGPGAYRIWILAGNRAQPDGRDIRVAGPDGQPVPFGILHSTAEGRHLLIFSQARTPDGQPLQGLYSVYFGNPRAGGVPPSFPKCGLTLETRAIPENADVSSWKAALDTLTRSNTVYLRDFWGQVFDAYNPFGPQSDYISIYDGYINCPSDGLYRFAVMSDDASFLLIDGGLVAEWPGRGHNIDEGRYGEHGGQKALNAGPHVFRYIAFSFGGPKRCGVCWVLPDAQIVTLRPEVRGYYYQVIPGSAFSSVPAATVKFCQHARQPVCADFSATPMHYLESGTAQLVAVRFDTLSTIEDGTVREYQWEFGDGQTSSEPGPVHAFLAPGTYEVKFSVTSSSGAKDTFTVKLDVRPIWHDLDFERSKKDKFWELTKDCQVARLSTAHLLAFREFLRDAEQRTKLFDTCAELDKRRAELQPVQIYDVAIDLAQYHLDPLGNWKAAENYLNLALQQCAEDDQARRFNAGFLLADLYFYYTNDLDRAREAYESLRRDLPGVDPIRTRVALIRLGDIQACQCNFEEARKLYSEAEADPTYSLKQSPSVIEGQFTQEVESRLREGDGKLALETLEQWLWHCPTRRLDGYPLILRLKANLLMHKYAEVRKQAKVYLGCSNDPDYVPQVHVLAGEACLELGMIEEARKHWMAVVKDWKESPAFKDAENGLYRLEH